MPKITFMEALRRKMSDEPEHRIDHAPLTMSMFLNKDELGKAQRTDFMRRLMSNLDGKKDRQIEALVKALRESRSALIAFKDAVESSGKMNGREYIGLGIQINDAIGRAHDVLADVSSSQVPSDH